MTIEVNDDDPLFSSDLARPSLVVVVVVVVYQAESNLGSWVPFSFN